MTTDSHDLPASAATGTSHCVVVGVDGSEHSGRALAWAAEEARLRHAKLRVVRAWHVPPLAYQAYMPPDLYEAEKASTSALEEQIVAVLDGHADLVVERVVAEGRAVQVLIDAAKGADLLVVGSRGHGGFSGLLLGSVSSQVVHHAQCPVAVIRP